MVLIERGDFQGLSGSQLFVNGQVFIKILGLVTSRSVA